jgi:glycine dehydrogenase subunit 2
MGPDGLRAVAENAVLNANYLLKRLEPYYDLPYPGPCMHECVFSARRQKRPGIAEARMVEPRARSSTL